MAAKLRFIFALCLASVLAACGSPKVDPHATARRSLDDTIMPGAQTGAVGSRVGVLDPLNDPNSPLSKRSVYFAFDRYGVAEEYQPLLQQHAKYLKENPQQHILIQGNTDERGTSEYNLALGQKRAEAVRHALVLMGVSDAQVEAVSLGKEKPQALGHDEESWSQNRRADIVYQ